MPEHSQRTPGIPKAALGVFSLLYLVMLVYGTLYPFDRWFVPQGGFLGNFLEADLSNLSRTDMITNVLVYMPAGLLWTALLARQMRWAAAVVLATVMGTGLSFSLEAVQVFLPFRNSALSDLVLNALGSGLGGAIALVLSAHTRAGSRLHNFRAHAFMPGAIANIGLLVLALWALSQLSPLVPSLGVSNLREGLKPLWFTLTGQASFVAGQSVEYFCVVLGLGGIFLSLSRARGLGLFLFMIFVAAVLLMKVPVMSRQLSAEALSGSVGALLVLSVLHRVPGRLLVTIAGAFLLAGFVTGALRESGSSTQTFAFNWVPFKGHMQNIVGLANILASSWVFLGMGYVARYLSRPSLAVVTAGVGALLILGLASLMEFLQLGIPGRVPDVTDVIIAVVAWLCAWIGGTRATDAQHAGGKSRTGYA